MSSSTPEPHPQALWSEDDMWWWDGAQWVRATPEQIRDHIRGRTGSTPPPPPPPAVAAQSSVAHRVDDSFAWAIALAPLAALLAAYLLPVYRWPVVFALVIVEAVLHVQDRKRLTAAGVHVRGRGTLPYLFSRSKALGQTMVVPIVSVAALGVAVLGWFTFAAVVELDPAKTESQLQSWAINNGAKGARVDCPDTMAGHVGDTFTCQITAGGQTGLIQVKLATKDSITWQPLSS